MEEKDFLKDLKVKTKVFLKKYWYIPAAFVGYFVYKKFGGSTKKFKRK